jgi:DNA mismatch repair protein MutS
MGNTAIKSTEELISEGHTPMMAQYHNIKQHHPDCLLFYRMGDFYELFFEDAIKAAEILDITLTKRGKNKGEGIDMCGVPYHSHEPYLAKLIKAGLKVAICEQTETPEQAKKRGGNKSLVNRDVVRIVTKGTLTEDHLLDVKQHHYLASIIELGGQFGLSWIDLSTGNFYVQPLNESEITTSLGRISPSELLAPDDAYLKKTLYGRSIDLDEIITTQPKTVFDSQNARKRLESYFGVQTLESFGGFSRAELSAAGSLLEYIERTQKGKIPHIQTLRQISTDEVLSIDYATLKNLEITKTLSGDKKGSLLSYIDKTRTAAGGRLLHSRIVAPLTCPDSINMRQNKVEDFVNNIQLRETLRASLSQIPDLERALSRITIGRAGPRDLGLVKNALESIKLIRNDLDRIYKGAAHLKPHIKDLDFNNEVNELRSILNHALKDELPTLEKDGNFIRPGFDDQLDRFKQLKEKSRKIIISLQEKYQKLTGIESLKINFNNVLGYFIEVSAKKADPLLVKNDQDNQQSNPFIHRQTMANAVRFTTAELSELERDIMQASEKALSIELEIFGRLIALVTNSAKQLSVIASAIAELDFYSSLAQLAVDECYVKPEVDNSLDFEIIEGRHPVVEQALKLQNGEKFIANNCQLNKTHNLWILTGPNMAGKSTFLRQNALIAIMAQAGSFVPASSAKIGVIDKIFSRVGAADDLARGQSTFMVEMVETASILNQATDKSFVILDEIGRGTATYDGLSIAWACVESLHDVNRCRSIFATHYHELTSLQNKLSSIGCYTMDVKEWDGDIVFLHKIRKGCADRSYGIHVAKLAGLPANVTKRAEQILKKLESPDNGTLSRKIPEELPLFSSISESQNNTHPAIKKLESLNPDELTPIEALELLYELKKSA